MFSTRLPRSCFGLRCSTAISCPPPLSNSSTSNRPMNRVPPITRTFIILQTAKPGRFAKCAHNPRRIQPRYRLIVIFQAQVRNQVFSPHPAQSVFELHELDEDVVL